MNEPRLADRFWLQATVLVCVGAVVYFFNTWTSGFSMSEGHRVAPAWEMLARGDWFLPHMFEQAYLRKPPGMPWAIASLSWLLGPTEFAARSVSGLAMVIGAVVSCWFGRRWFGARAGWAAGLMHVLLPWMWESGRAAEIESLNNLGTVCAAWGCLDLLVRAGSRNWTSIAIAVAGSVVAAMAKGPASLPVILAIPLAACWAARNLSPLKSKGFLVAAGLTVLVLGVLAALVVRRIANESSPIVTQGVSEFLWSAAKAPQILALPLVFLVSALPASLALLPALAARGLEVEQIRIARVLGVSVLIAIATYTIAGVSNPRYTLPAAAVLSPLMGFAMLIWEQQAAGAGLQSRLAQLAFSLARPACGVLLIAAVGYAIVSEQRRAASSGRVAGIALGEFVDDDSLIVANDMIEARPEIFLYAAANAESHGKRVRVKWLPMMSTLSINELPAAKNVYVVLRTDAGSSELETLKKSGVLEQLQLTAFHMRVGPENRPFEGMLYRVRTR